MTTSVTIEKLPDDPLCLRVSAGGENGKGYYVRYRGDRKEVLEALEAITDAFWKYQLIPEVRVDTSHRGAANKGN